MKYMSCSMCHFILDNNICQISYDNLDTQFDANGDNSCYGFICASCIELENEVLALKQMRDHMSVKLVEHNEMSANLEK